MALSPAAGDTAGWCLVLPLKPLRTAKSRLVGVPAGTRQGLVVAMARDVCAAALDCPDVGEIVVVTRDPGWRGRLAAAGVRLVVEEPRAALNEALEAAAASCRAGRPDLGVAALTADLPALRAAELGTALRSSTGSRPTFVPDAAGVGTTLLAAPPTVPFAPRYGERSRARHLASGARELAFPAGSGIRQDVDTLPDLRRAHALGVGRQTRTVLARTVPRPRPLPRTPWHRPEAAAGRDRAERVR